MSASKVRVAKLLPLEHRLGRAELATTIASMRRRGIAWVIAACVLTVPVVLVALAAPTQAAILAGALLVLGAALALPKEIVLGVALSFALVTLLLVIGLTGRSGPMQTYATLVCIALVAVAWARSPRRSGRPPLAALILAALFTLTAGATLASATPDWFYGAISGLTAVVALASNRMTTDGRRFFMRTILVSAVVLSVIAIAELMTDQLFWAGVRVGQSSHAFIPGAVRAEATVGHPLVLGVVLLVAALLLVNRPGRWIVKASGLVLFGAGMLATGSASIVAVAAAGVIFTLGLRAGWHGRVALVFFSGAAIVLMTLGGFWPTTLAREFSGLNIAQRARSLEAVPNLLTQQDLGVSLFGSGWGSIERLYSEGVLVASGFLAVDNQWVTTLIQAGVLGLLILLVGVMAAIARARREFTFALVGVVLLFFSFDVLMWALPGLLLGYMAGSPRDESASIDEPHMAQAVLTLNAPK